MLTPLKNRTMCLNRNHDLAASRPTLDVCSYSPMFPTVRSFILYASLSDDLFWRFFGFSLLDVFVINLALSQLGCVKSAHLAPCHFSFL